MNSRPTQLDCQCFKEIGRIDLLRRLIVEKVIFVEAVVFWYQKSKMADDITVIFKVIKLYLGAPF